MSPRVTRSQGWAVAALVAAVSLLAGGCVAGATFAPATAVPTGGLGAPVPAAPAGAVPRSDAPAASSPGDAPVASSPADAPAVSPSQPTPAPSQPTPAPFEPTPPAQSPTRPAQSPTPTPPEAACRCACVSPGAAAYPGVVVAGVALEGGPFFSRATTELDIRRGQGLVVLADTVVDGVFLDRFQQWDEGAVWWETMPGASIDAQSIRIDLDGAWTLEAASVQADNNDAYRLAYRDMATGEWLTLITVPPEYGFGMVTRPDQYDDTARREFLRTVTTDALRLEAAEGDGMYAISEIQVFGTRAVTATSLPGA